MMRPAGPVFTYTVDVRLIALVRDNPELYDVLHSQYSNISHKDEVWKEIGEKLQQSSNACRKRWISLRSQYRKFLYAKKFGTGAFGRLLKCKYGEHLDFLVQHVKISEEISDNDYQLPYHSPPYQLKDIKVEEGTVCINTEETNEFQTQGNTEAVRCHDMEPVKPNVLHEASCNESKDHKDSLDCFFDHIKCTVKDFSLQDKYIVKEKVFQIVAGIKKKYISQ